jgi:hypothetical protein
MADDPGMTLTGQRIKQLTDEAEGALLREAREAAAWHDIYPVRVYEILGNLYTLVSPLPSSPRCSRAPSPAAAGRNPPSPLRALPR